MALLLGDVEVDQVMSMADCVEVMEDAFQQAGQGRHVEPALAPASGCLVAFII